VLSPDSPSPPNLIIGLEPNHKPNEKTEVI
jgi:hypothetical protein